MTDYTERTRILVVLDLDDALVHSEEVPFSDRPADFSPGEGIYTIKRPGLDHFLQCVFAIADVAVWSSGTEAYVHAIVESIFPEHTRLRFVWSRDRCTERRDEATGEVYWSKPLAKVRRRGYELSRVVTLDDDARTAKQNRGNLVAIRAWTGDPFDRELDRVLGVLERLQSAPDVRKVRK